ncbi:diguanylate cyclase [Rubellimicrobium rubrum]|uniref:Diguanylate cyclase n=1 Tax=Rubellimicrobium rubrum TaxID=2585369 RepID=A0A5C4MTL4_9RHOB|nr:diguanylate cyclase [Rubellimicrobium rubrum]TNC48700.1 diguanylate cyclase [Rubellimicrobium rubrum]
MGQTTARLYRSMQNRRVLARYICALLVLAGLTAGSFVTMRHLIGGMKQGEVLITEAADLRSAIHKTMLALDAIAQGNPEAASRAAREAEALNSGLDRLITTMVRVGADQEDWALIQDPDTGLQASVLALVQTATAADRRGAVGPGGIPHMLESKESRGDTMTGPAISAMDQGGHVEPHGTEARALATSPLPSHRSTSHAGHSPAMASIDTLIEHLRGDRQAEQKRTSRLHDLLGVATLVILLAEAFVVFRPLMSRADREAARADVALSELEYLASHDALTGLLNRGQIDRILDIAVHEASSESRQLGLVLLDLDEFKPINDRFGHAAGDAVLVAVANRIRGLVGPTGVAGRLGGDEFIVLVRGSQVEKEVAALASRLLDELRKPFEYRGQLLHPRASIGYAVFPAAGSDVATLLSAADSAMYTAKRSGRGRVSVFSEQMRAEADRTRRLERDVREAFEGGQFDVRYDAVFDTSLGLIGVEGLPHWHHPARGSVPTDQLLAEVAAVGQTPALTDFVIFTALAQAAEWQRLHLPFGAIHVNAGEGFLRRGDACSVLQHALVSSGLDSAALVIRLGAEVLIDDPVIARAIHGLQDMGIAVGIGGFGTGSRPLLALEGINIGFVALGREVLVRAEASKEGKAVVAAMLELCRAMGKDVLMQDIDTAALAELAQSEHVTARQGKHLCGRMDAAEMTAFIRKAASGPAPRVCPVTDAEDAPRTLSVLGRPAA